MPGTKPASARQARILLVDDDDGFRESLSLNLIDEGFAVTTFSGASPALDFLASGEAVDVILLDWRMPGMNGLEMLRELRQRGTMTPVIFLTALSDDIYEEAALAGGAVDFIDKSRRLSILVKRIELIAEGQRPLPDAAQQQPAQVRLGQLELRFDINRAFWNGQAIDLTLTEFRMVSQLALKPGEDLSYRELYDLVHGKDFLAGSGTEGYRANVRTFIKRIRKKFRDVDTEFDQIHNYAGFGYRWTVA
ncbi:MAG TPA: response regulator transcription factor [Stellaceae bacterium]|nr:response regulator transcription factor [Stellaceae bacterium]